MAQCQSRLIIETLRMQLPDEHFLISIAMPIWLIAAGLLMLWNGYFTTVKQASGKNALSLLKDPRNAA